MKQIVQFLLIITLCGCALAIPGNSTSPTPPTPTTVVTSTYTPSGTAIPTLLPSTTPSPTPMPPIPLATLTAGEAKKLVRDLLDNNGGCQLPCWWSITPGITTWAEARHFLESFAIYFGESGSTDTIYESVDIPLPSAYSNATNMEHTYTVKGGIVDSIEVFNYNLAPNYYFPKFLETYGQPAEVWIRTFSQSEMGLQPFLIDLFYPDQGILVEYSTTYPLKEIGGKLQNCFIKGADSPFIFLWSPEKQYLSFQDAKRFLDTASLPEPRPLFEATGMDVTTFYKTYKNPQTDICLETDKNLWP